MNIVITLKDSSPSWDGETEPTDATMSLSFNAETALLDPEQVSVMNNEFGTDSCFLPFFSDSSSAVAKKNKWILGSYVNQHYYTVYDASSVDIHMQNPEEPLGPSRIGIALANPENKIEPKAEIHKNHTLTIIIIVVLSLLVIGAVVGFLIYKRRQNSENLNQILGSN